MKPFQDQVIVITGGATGIGLATASALAAQGAQVVLAGRNQERGAAAIQAIVQRGGKAHFVPTDVRDEDAVSHLFDDTRRTFGRLDGLFNNAGTEGVPGPLTDYPVARMDEILDTNLKGVLLCLKHALPLLSSHGVIVNTASFVGTLVPVPHSVVYGASKAAVLSITAAVAAGVAERGIRVYALCPWITDTPMVDRLTGHQASAKAGFAAMNPSRQIVTPADVASVVAALFADGAGYQSGDGVLVDSGGRTQNIQTFHQLTCETH